ncbi:hypothetical protein BCEN4_850014 [Burkholderia cenocepacia]|nr:hypothetical protein BCEN4_850014 [Burkholderia cenocepacia]
MIWIQMGQLGIWYRIKNLENLYRILLEKYYIDRAKWSVRPCVDHYFTKGLEARSKSSCCG